MRRVGRWLFNGLTTLSLVLFVGLVVLWVRSLYRTEGVEYLNCYFGPGAATVEDTAGSISARRPWWSTKMWFETWTASTDRWGITLALSRVDARVFLGEGTPSGWHHWSSSVSRNDATYWPAYTLTGRLVPPNVGGSLKVKVPYWFGIIVFAALPTILTSRLVRSRRRLPGSCKHCGYNLTGNVSGVCPECGKPIASKG